MQHLNPADICNAIEAPWAIDHVALPAYVPDPEIEETIDEIRRLFGLRQNMIQSQTKITLQAQAVLRLIMASDEDFSSDDAKAKARKRNEKLFAQVAKDPEHPLHQHIAIYLESIELFAGRRASIEKEMVRHVKKLPMYQWAKETKGLGDIGLATIVGACGDIGTYKSVSAVWKRMGLAVINGKRQGAPGKNATDTDWIEHGYSPRRRSAMWNVGNSLILGMGKFRPEYNEDVDANPEYTPYQRVFANRARYEATRLPKAEGVPVAVNPKTGKESYSAHAANRAKRYVEKRLLKDLYLNWRRAA